MPLLLSITPGNVSDPIEGRRMLEVFGKVSEGTILLTDRGYEDDQTRRMAASHGFTQVVPPNPNRKQPWPYDKKLYAKRNIVERFFSRIKRYRRVATRYDKLARMFAAFLILASIFILPPM
jgi:transposase